MSKVTEFALLLSIYKAPKTAADLSIQDWNQVIQQANEASITATLYAVLNKEKILGKIPDRIRDHLEWANVTAKKHRQDVLWEVNRIQKALSHLNISILFLKGAAYLIADLPPSHGRLFSDVDILVPKDQLNAVEAALMLNGWMTTHHDAYDQRYYRTWMHELPPMQHIKRMTVIDVHHAIVPQTACVQPDPEKLIKDAQPIPNFKSIFVLSPEDMVLHSAVHLFNGSEFNNGMRDLIDLDMLLRHFGTSHAFWTKLIDRAEVMELTRPLFYAFRYTKHFLDTPIPSEVLNKIDKTRPNKLLKILMDSFFKRALVPTHVMRYRHLTQIAHHVLYIRGNWLRMPPLLLIRHLCHKALFSSKQDQA